MGGVVEGAALGALFQVLFTTVVNASFRLSHFRSQLDRLKSTLSFIKPAIDDVENFDRFLERPLLEAQVFSHHLLKGQQLISKCSKVNKWNVFERFYYAHKLTQFEASLVRFFQIDVAALHLRESKSISAKMSNLEDKVKEIVAILKTNEIDSNSSGHGRRINHEFEELKSTGIDKDDEEEGVILGKCSEFQDHMVDPHTPCPHHD